MNELQRLYVTIGNAGCSVSDSILVTQTTTGLQGIDGLSIDVEIYPNPTDGMLYVRSNGTGHYELTVYNTVGKLIFETATNESMTLIDMSEHAAGTYFIRVTADKYTRTIKVLLNR